MERNKSGCMNSTCKYNSMILKQGTTKPCNKILTCRSRIQPSLKIARDRASYYPPNYYFPPPELIEQAHSQIGSLNYKKIMKKVVKQQKTLFTPSIQVNVLQSKTIKVANS